jgi:hypothetical protein
MDETTRKQIELATVPVRSKGMTPGKGPQGVFIGNGFVLTAAHCLKFDTYGGIALGDHVIYYIDRPEGEPIWCSPVCIDPCSDLAVVGPCDSQTFAERHSDFLSFFEDVVPIGIRRDPLRLDEATPCEIRTHLRTWVSGKLTRHSDSPWAWLHADENIFGGTSGSPIVDDDGQILGVMSIAGGSGDVTNSGPHSIPSLWLPSWLLASVPGEW